MELYIEETSATRSCAINLGNLTWSKAKLTTTYDKCKPVSSARPCKGSSLGRDHAIAGAFAIIILLIGAAVFCRMYVLMQQLWSINYVLTTLLSTRVSQDRINHIVEIPINSPVSFLKYTGGIVLSCVKQQTTNTLDTQ